MPLRPLDENVYQQAMSGNTIAGFFMLKGMRPLTYRDDVKFEHADTVIWASLNLHELDAGERAALQKLALRRAQWRAGAENVAPGDAVP
jgi:hypothetical protein